MRALLPPFLIMAVLAATPSKAEKVISCPDGKIKGCEVFTDPLGNRVDPVSCPASHCKTFEPRMVDGKKSCPFNCPEYFQDR